MEIEHAQSHAFAGERLQLQRCTDLQGSIEIRNVRLAIEDRKTESLLNIRGDRDKTYVNMDAA
jgi:hypothetical protein